MIPRYRKHLVILLGLCGLVFFAQRIQAADKKVTPPKTIAYQDKELRYDPTEQNQETYLEENLDDDPEPEVIISFAASYKPPSPVEPREDVKPLTAAPRVIPIIEHYTFFQVYDSEAGGLYRLVKTLNGMGRIGTVTLVRPKPGSLPVMVFVSPGGETYADVSVYQWRNDGFRRLLNEGGKLRTISLDTTSAPPSLQVENRRYAWDDAQKTFVLKPMAQENPGKPLTDTL
jgi:hypothetical protein